LGMLWALLLGDRGDVRQYSVFSNCSSMVTVSPSGPSVSFWIGNDLFTTLFTAQMGRGS
jgi:hypothetical protein